MLNLDYIADDEYLSNIIEFKKDDIRDIFSYIGFDTEELFCKEESMSRYIFLQGDEHEVYNSSERTFIESIDSIFVFQTFYKKTKRGKIPCRIVAVELDEDNNDLTTPIFFIKEINKAIDGFNIFLIKTGNSFYFGMRSYDNSRNEDFMISPSIKLCKDLQEISDKLAYINSNDEFIDFYNCLSSAMETSLDDELLYDAYNNQDESSRYGLLLNEVGAIYHLDFSEEISRFYDSLHSDVVVSFKTLLDEASEELSFIKSNKVNTMEMLFEADELAQLAQRAEDEHNSIIQKSIHNNSDEENDDIKEYLDDPETMIKLLKQRKGLQYEWLQLKRS